MSHPQKLQQLQERIQKGENLTKIDLLDCHLTEFPLDILFPIKDSIEIINLGGNHLSSLPDEISQFTKLRILFFANNNFSTVPKVLGSMSSLYMLSFKANKLVEIHPDSLSPSIHWLILTDNQLTTLPPTIGKLTHLRKFLLSGNNLASLPGEMQHCRELELLRLSVNKLTTLPDWLFDLPKLAWAAFSSNLFQMENNEIVCSNTSPISWNDLEVHEKLGEGASGEIYRGVMKGPVLQYVAIKLFKNAINSDGSSEDEIQVTERVGNHSNFIGIHGRVINHPDGKMGMILPLLNNTDYYSLGKPPSFDSITRDTYEANAIFSVPFIYNVAHNIARAGEHLHAQGIIHGDLYAHNILTKYDGSCILTDFGAATFLLNKFSPSTIEKLKKIEVRAYGNLLDDLLTRIDVESVQSHPETYQQLLQLRDDCTSLVVDRRPSFSNIRSSLEIGKV